MCQRYKLNNLMNLRIYIKSFLLLLVSLTLIESAVAQINKNAVNKMNIIGIVKDGSTKINLKNVTVNFYGPVNGDLLTAAQTDDLGSFRIVKPPTSKRILLRISHIGYTAYIKTFNLQDGENVNNLGTVMLYPVVPKSNNLNTVDVHGSKRDFENIEGRVKGRIKDSIYRYVLSSATVSVYNRTDSSLLRFSIPNNFGEFDIQKLPINTPLKLLITHVGYTPYRISFELTQKKNAIDFDWIYMFQNAGKANTLEDVNITSYAPVRMNGDTLEFNPRAFKMDVNATTEDLMRILPGMVVWGDGDITYNGKKINSLLVDGKPFMGSSDFTTATQNLPKDVLDKVQIYSRRNEKNPLDSTLNANLKLKDDKKVGYFGKIAAGYGTENKFFTDAMLSSYNKKLQVVAVGALNNINKSAGDINTLIRYNSYKGEGNNIEYQSDFKRAGINFGKTAGARLQYELIPSISDRKGRRLTSEYLFKQNNETINSTRLSRTILRTDSILTSESINQSTNISTNNNLSYNYSQQEKNFNLTVSGDAEIGQSNNTSRSNGEQSLTGTSGQLGNNSSLKNSNNSYGKMSLVTQFDFQKEIFDIGATKRRKRHLLNNFTVGYSYSYEENKGELNNLSSLSSSLNPSVNKFFDRLYQHKNTSNRHTVNVAYPNIKKLLFGFGSLGGIKLELSSNFSFGEDNVSLFVLDANAKTKQREENLNLTNNRREIAQDIQPKLSISKNFYKGLTNRFNQSLDIFIIPGLQYYSKQSSALQQTQNFSYHYKQFIPNSSISYNNHQYGRFEIKSSLNYNTQVNYPNVEHIAPLVDSANVWYIPKGNFHIKPEYINSFTWKTSFQSRKPKNPYQLDLSIDVNFAKNKISDSTFYDNIGRRINYNINLNGNRYWHIGGYYRKAYSPNKSNTYRLNIWYNYYDYYVPQYLDAVLISSNNKNNNFDIEVAYSFLDIINLNAKQGFNLYRNVQTASNEQYSGLNNYTRFSGTLQLPKNLSWSTNVNFNTNKAVNQPTVNYMIWNASLTYRFMQGNRAEMKFSALDILRQNKSVINNTNRNVQTFGFNNVLQQYFMVSLAYYPRKFGAKNISLDKKN